MPIDAQFYDGNQADVTTHQANWNQLREQIGDDFIYIADSKLCSSENLATIDRHGGKFITVVPRNFKEAKGFLWRAQSGEEIDWQHTYSVADSRKKGRSRLYRIHEGERMDEGYRILWIHSQSKEIKESAARERRILKAEKALEALAPKLNQRQLKGEEKITKAIKKATQGASAYLNIALHTEERIVRKQRGRGRPGPDTRYSEITELQYRLEWERNQSEIEQAQRTDGLFPLVDNTDLDAVEVLRTYKNQPYLEKRFHTSKNDLKVAPVFLKKNATH